MNPHNGQQPSSAEARPPRKQWKRDWSTWILILFLPAMIVGLIGLNRVMGSVGYGLGGLLVMLALLGLPIALLAKLIRRLRKLVRRHRQH